MVVNRRKEMFLLAKQEPNSLIAESYRSIRTFLKYGAMDQDRKVILFSSPQIGEGKTTAVSNLGYLLAQDGKKTLLVDCDLRRPNLHHIFRVPNRSGISSYLSGYSGIQDIVFPTEIENLDLVPAGPIQPNAAELLGSTRLAQFMEKMRESYDVILLDTPPLLSVSDAIITARTIDGIVIIIRSLKTRREHIRKTQHLLEPLKEKMLGFILNDKKNK